MFISWWRQWVQRRARASRRKQCRRAEGRHVSTYRIWFEPLEDRLAPAAIIWTDRPDYLARSTATIIGSGFQPGETVQLQVLHTTGDPSSFANHDPWLVTDGALGIWMA